MFKTIKNWLTKPRIKSLFFAYTAVIILLAVLPINSTGSTINHTFIVTIRLDYLLHCAMFLPWMFLMRKFSRTSFQFSISRSSIWILAALIFATLMEILQYYLPYRAFNVNDLLANGLGVLLGTVLFIR